MAMVNVPLLQLIDMPASYLLLGYSQVIPNYSSKELYDKMFALGVTMYGQMTAGSYCYIGPQGIVHGTTVKLNMLRLTIE